MKMTYHILILFFASILLSSCFEIIEEISLNENGSGTFTYTVNLSQSKSKLQSIMSLDSVNGYKVPKQEEITNKIEEAGNIFIDMDGISQVKIETNFTDYIFSLSCNFSNISHLNNAINNTITNLQKNNFNPSDNFTFTNDTFTRHNKYETYDAYEKLQNKDQIIFDNAKYVAIYRFKKDILSFTNAKAKQSKSKKAIMLKVDIIDLITKKSDIQNSIKISH